MYIPRDMRTGDPRGFAFVRFLDQRDADDALDRLDGERMNGRELRIEVRTGVHVWHVCACVCLCVCACVCAHVGVLPAARLAGWLATPPLLAHSFLVDM